MATPLPIEPLAPPAEVQVAAEKIQEIRQRVWGIDARVDPTVYFEEFSYWAKIDREEEREAERKFREMQGPWSFKKMIMNRFSKGAHHEKAKMEERIRQEQAMVAAGADEKGAVVVQNGEVSSLAVSEEEWKTASRALRTAGWGSIFFLITTDILGWSGCPAVFASVGYGPGIALYTIFGLAAGLSGFFLWSVYMALDSSRFPMMSYGDLFFRVFGPKARHFINVTQSFQQFCTVCVLILGNGMVVSQLAGPGLCFIACLIIIMVSGMVAGFIRSLQRVGWLANLSVWMNVVTFIIIMVAAAKYPIDYPVAWGQTILPKKVLPVMTFAGPPPGQYQQQIPGFASQFNAVDSMVYAYSGALIFVAFMAEMRHPMDFWKGMVIAQVFICVVYMMFGAYVYSYFGQYAVSNINQVIQPLTLQSVTNYFTLFTGFIAAVLYFNIGMKTVYLEVFQEVLHFPPITTKKGRWMWYGLGPVYWALALIIAAAVPNLFGLVNFIGGLLSLNFTYSFPCIVWLGWSIRDSSALPGEGFDPVTGVTTRHDNGITRWVRGFGKRWFVHSLCVIFTCCALATSGMGTWAAVEGLISVFGPGGTVATSFGCKSPVFG